MGVSRFPSNTFNFLRWRRVSGSALKSQLPICDLDPIELTVDAPTNLTGTALSDDLINLNWTDNSNNEISFCIERSLDNVTFSEIGSVVENVVTFNDTTVSQNTTYYYRLRAKGSSINSSYSNILQIKTPIAINLTTYKNTGVDGAFIVNVGNVTNTTRFVLPDGSNIQTNNLSTTIPQLNGTNQVVKMLLLDTDPYIDLDIPGKPKLTSTLDLSGVKLRSINMGSVSFDSNESGTISQFIAPTQTDICNSFVVADIFSCPVDLSGMSNLSTEVTFNKSDDITGFTYNPSSVNNNPVAFSFNSDINITGVTGTIDISGFGNLIGSFFLSLLPNLSNIVLPVSPNVNGNVQIRARNATVNGTQTLDISTLFPNMNGGLVVNIGTDNLILPTINPLLSLTVNDSQLTSIDMTNAKFANNMNFIYRGNSGTGVTFDFTQPDTFTGLSFSNQAAGSGIAGFVFPAASTFREFITNFAGDWRDTNGDIDVRGINLTTGATLSVAASGTPVDMIVDSLPTTADIVNVLFFGFTDLTIDPDFNIAARYTSKRYDFRQATLSVSEVDAIVNSIYANRLALSSAFGTDAKILTFESGNNGNDNGSPSGTYQAPSGFVLGSSDGSPTNARQQIFVLVNNYNFTITVHEGAGANTVYS